MDTTTLPRQLLSIKEYLALGEVEPGFTELVEGRLVFSPSPGAWHNHVTYALAFQLHEQLPSGFSVVPRVDIDLGLAPDGAPGFSRCPDLLVTTSAAIARTPEEAALRAEDLVLVVEVAAPDSKRTDYVTKHQEYADAGILFYWILDLDDPISLVACHRAGELGYQDAPAVTGKFRAAEPFPFELDLAALLR
ncbi:Uma2 family endonuclease [Amycolatopsis silviterrae]|uniref:Uma2 family endonuclease n=1 Tax=Amycolatopsis silviterrae TaxID=1656914 RepID=A0ABW5GZN8_9PSEU